MALRFDLKAILSTPNEKYFEHLNRFLVLVEPIIEDLERKKFI
ncbi:hypothetical protein SAMN04488511_11943 [Pedobacter suwonensis]|uniref:Uncharacterized protein n=1 Tax=Pedobacter suwonensis TaxID=332999 RepID=A0A1I0U306_9SPHI|nr:hypothetical protein SAMN04488511_11943 [Pedobacter suwonensis]